MPFWKRAFYLTFGALALLFGLAIIGWVIYNEFIHKLPEFKRPPLVGYFGMGPVMSYFGWLWLRKAFKRNSNTAEQGAAANP
jgi:hypothetical protein